MKRSSDHHAERCRELADILIAPLREVARRNGYALAVHGSLSYDIDLIACPWRELATPAEYVAKQISQAIEAIVGTTAIHGPEQKPFGRKAWSIHMGGGPYVDLSVMPVYEQQEQSIDEERPQEQKSPTPILSAEPWRGGDLPHKPHP